MQTPCKNCKALSHSDYPSQKSTTIFIDGVPAGGNDKWVCMKCETEICINCYMRHIDKDHPEMYSCECETCKSMTLPEDFREYKRCVKCINKKGE